MTCIVGLTEGGVTWMGGDSCASTNWDKLTIKQRKVFKMKDSKNLILGFSGTVRDLNLLQYATNLIDKRDEPNIDHEYIVTKFIPNLIKLLEDNGSSIISNNQKEADSYFLLAYKDKMWKIESNFSVIGVDENYMSVGSGTFHAVGSMATTEDSKLTPTERIHKALQIASKFAVGVAPPFCIINTENDEVVEFKE